MIATSAPPSSVTACRTAARSRSRSSSSSTATALPCGAATSAGSMRSAWTCSARRRPPGRSRARPPIPGCGGHRFRRRPVEGEAMTPLPIFLEALARAADAANVAEAEFRREVAARAKTLETERIFAFRRLNLMRAIADAVAAAPDAAVALAAGGAALRETLGWASDSEARDAVLARFVPVVEAVSSSLAPENHDEQTASAVTEALGAFER